MRSPITRTEIIGEIELTLGGKLHPQGEALKQIANHVSKTGDTTGSYSVEFNNGHGVSVYLNQQEEEA